MPCRGIQRTEPRLAGLRGPSCAANLAPSLLALYNCEINAEDELSELLESKVTTRGTS
jgi:hypothetical protein